MSFHLYSTIYFRFGIVISSCCLRTVSSGQERRRPMKMMSKIRNRVGKELYYLRYSKPIQSTVIAATRYLRCPSYVFHQKPWYELVLLTSVAYVLVQANNLRLFSLTNNCPNNKNSTTQLRSRHTVQFFMQLTMQFYSSEM